MKTLEESIKEHIESGQYFTDMRQWYSDKYQSAALHRSYLLVATVLFSVLLVSLGVYIFSLLPIKRSIYYALNVNASEGQAAILDLTHRYLSPQDLVIELLTSAYVKRREAYNYDALQAQYNYVYFKSSKSVFQKYQAYMSLGNKSSPLLRYQKAAVRTIDIKSATSTSNTAIIVFDSTAVEQTGRAIEKLRWQATLSFSMDSVDANTPSATDLNFIVLDYKLKLLADLIQSANEIAP